MTQAELAPIVKQAIANWEALGLTKNEVSELNQVQFRIANLGGNGVLGLTGMGSTLVSLDATAAGYGWFIDATPATNGEFSKAAGPYQLDAAAGSPAFGHMDLLTVVEHELGHVLGLPDLDPKTNPDVLMTQTLGTGERRLLQAAVLPANPHRRPDKDAAGDFGCRCRIPGPRRGPVLPGRRRWFDRFRHPTAERRYCSADARACGGADRWRFRGTARESQAGEGRGQWPGFDLPR